LYLLDETKYALFKVSAGGRGTVPGEIIASNKALKAVLETAGNGDQKKKQEGSEVATEEEGRERIPEADYAEKDEGIEIRNDTNTIISSSTSDDSVWYNYFLKVPFPRQPSAEEREKLEGRAYFEVTLVDVANRDAENGGRVAIGFADYNLIDDDEGDFTIGENPISFGFHNVEDGDVMGPGVHADDDSSDSDNNQIEIPLAANGDTLGMGIDYRIGKAFLTYNGRKVRDFWNLQDEDHESVCSISLTIYLSIYLFITGLRFPQLMFI
jgi:hypothetical protein